MKKNARICPTADIGSGLRIGGAELQYSCYPDATAAYNAALRCHSHPLGIPDGPTPKALIEQRNVCILLIV